MSDDWDDDDDGWGDDGGDGGGDDDGWGDDGDEDQWEDADFGGDDFSAALSGRVLVENQSVEAETSYRSFKKANSTAEKERHGQTAIAAFRECIRLEEKETPDSAEFSVSSAANIVQIYCQLNEEGEIEGAIREFVAFYRPEIAKDFFAQVTSIVSTLDRLPNVELRSRMFELLLNAIEPLSETEWQKYATRFCKMYLSLGAFDKVKQFLEAMHNKCRLENGEDDPHKGDQLLKIYAIEIQVATAKGDEVGLNDLFKKTESLTTAISDSAAMSVIQECYGKMFASRNQWAKAYNEFFAAFRHALESINAAGEAETCLCYVILSSMLSPESVNPFASQEARSLEEAYQVKHMAELLNAFEGDDINRFERVLASNHKKIYDNTFLAQHMSAVMLRLRSRVLVKLIKPYRRVRLQWLSRKLNATEDEVEQLVVNCILDGSVKGRVDQIHAVLDLEFGVTKADDLYTAVEAWMSTVKKMQNNLSSRSARTGGPGMGGGHFGGAWGDFDDEDFPLFGGGDMFGYDGGW